MTRTPFQSAGTQMNQQSAAGGLAGQLRQAARGARRVLVRGPDRASRREAKGSDEQSEQHEQADSGTHDDLPLFAQMACSVSRSGASPPEALRNSTRWMWVYNAR